MNNNILCIGAGYVGGPTMAMIAYKCHDIKVTIVDINQERIDAWNSDELPIYEPGLDEIVKSRRNKNLFFSTDIEKGIIDNDIIFVSVNTPTKTFGHGAGYAADLQYWEKCARHIRDVANTDKIVIEKSTLPVRTAAAMARILEHGSKNTAFTVLSNPEFLAEGTAVDDLQNPDRVLIGGAQTEQGKFAIEKLAAIYARWVDDEKILRTNLWSSELSKLTANAFLAQRVSSINSISALCEKTEADVSEVAHAIGADKRIGPKFLKASIGFGGSCFKKDILNLVYICETYGLTECAEYWKQVVVMNEYQESRFVARMLKAMFNTIAGKKIAILGFAFKADTGDTRESPAIKVCKQLLQENAIITISDPKALKSAKEDLANVENIDNIVFEPDPYKATQGAHAIALLTDWRNYKQLDFNKIYQTMEKPAFFFDGRNHIDSQMLYDIGFNVYTIGKTEKTHI